MVEISNDVTETIVVDSLDDSETVDFLKQRLPESSTTFISMPPGLYRAWNTGIEKAKADAHGRFYCYHKTSDRHVKMNSLNLSWVPNALFKIVLTQVRKQSNKDAEVELDFSQMPTLGKVYRRKYYFKVLLRRLKALVNNY